MFASILLALQVQAYRAVLVPAGFGCRFHVDTSDTVNSLQGWLLLLLLSMVSSQAPASPGEPSDGSLAERWSMAECMTDSHTSSMFGITKIFCSGKKGRLEYQALPGNPWG